MQKIHVTIASFVNQAIQLGFAQELDRVYLQNRLIAMLDLKGFQDLGQNDLSLLENMDQMVNYAKQRGIIQTSTSAREIFEAQIMDLITPLPSQLNQTFWEKYQESAQAATEYFYQLSRTNDYIKTRQIAKNIIFQYESDYGCLDITINLSKPEKTTQEIALARQMESSSYPMCALCFENEGFKGDLNHAARTNHRLIRLEVNGEGYGLQYSPYAYFDQHCIFVHQAHQPMAINRRTFANLLAIVDRFPHYFAGSNADLPITGGSILSHDHYQGGRHHFAMARAKVSETYQLADFPDLTVEHLYWPMSVIRLRHTDPKLVLDAAEMIFNHWLEYSDESLEILAYSNGERHNTITPIARRRDKAFELDLVLRNNRTNEHYPDGIFHPHQDVQHIKKENIGLIEVMGLAILPPRLLKEVEAVKAYLKVEIPLEQVPGIHQAWAQSLKESVLHEDQSQLDDLIQDAIGQKFQRVLEDAGVFKTDQAGQAGFQRFMDSLNAR